MYKIILSLDHGKRVIHFEKKKNEHIVSVIEQAVNAP